MSDDKKKNKVSSLLNQPARWLPKVWDWKSKKGGPVSKAKSLRDKRNNESKNND